MIKIVKILTVAAVYNGKMVVDGVTYDSWKGVDGVTYLI